MAPKPVTLTFAGDSSALERTFDKVGAGAVDMAKDFDKAGGEAKRFGGAMDSAAGAADASEGKFMGAADLLDGLGGAFGLPTEGATNLMRSFGDLTGGFAALGPMFTGLAAKLGITTAATWVFNAAQTALNFVLSANPIGLVVLSIAALVGAFVLAWQHSDTFRNIVRNAMEGVSIAVGWVVDRFKDLWGWISGITAHVRSALSGMGDAFLAPFRWAFNEIRNLWNRTAGGFRFEIPDWIPGVGGRGFSLPRMHMGGVVPGPAGADVPIMAQAGERIIRRGATTGGGTVIININLNASIIDPDVGARLAAVLREEQRRSGALGINLS